MMNQIVEVLFVEKAGPRAKISMFFLSQNFVQLKSNSSLHHDILLCCEDCLTMESSSTTGESVEAMLQCVGNANKKGHH